MNRVLITGGAGFIGSHLADLLLSLGRQVMLFDCIVKQVHPESPNWPDYLCLQDDRDGLWTWFGDVRDPRAVMDALLNFKPDTVVHLAAEVGVAQSNDETARYVSANCTGTAVVLDCVRAYNGHTEMRAGLLDQLDQPPPRPERDPGESDESFAERASRGEAELVAWESEIRRNIAVLPEKPVDKVFVAGSMSSYGDPGDGVRVVPEWWPRAPVSVYAHTKRMQEDLAGMAWAHHRLDVRVGRFFNVVGPRQALTNPYTGVAATFAARVLAGLRPRVYGDGLQTRDFVDVRDVASAIVAILENGRAGGVYNVATGTPTTILGLAEAICSALGRNDLSPDVTGLHRVGDVRHCVGDATLLRAIGWTPTRTLAETVRDLAEWVAAQPASDARVLDRAHNDLIEAGLLSGAEKTP